MRSAAAAEVSPSPAVASPLMTSLEHRDIGWMCGEPMADYAHVVFEAVDRDEDGKR